MRRPYKRHAPAEVRLWRRVRKGPGCWIWTGPVNSRGYGAIGVDNGEVTGTHRLSWEIFFGPIAPGLSVLHRCDTPPCCTPDHLFLGTVKDNAEDMVRKGRHRPASLPGELNPSARLTWEQVVEIRAARAAGARPRDLAARYGVGKTTIEYAARGLTWKS